VPDSPNPRTSAKTDRTSRLMAFASLVVAIIALFVSIWSTQTDRRVQVIAEARPVLEETRNTGVVLGELGLVVEVPWEVTIRNVGLRDTSIVDYRVRTWNEAGLMDYSGLDVGAFDASGSEPLQLPRTLPANDSIRFLVVAGILVIAEAEEVIADAESEYVPWQWLSREMARRGTDLFGNPVTLVELPDDNYLISQDDATAPNQFIAFEFETVQGDLLEAVVCTPPSFGTC
jgi:hypothetical protein